MNNGEPRNTNTKASQGRRTQPCREPLPSATSAVLLTAYMAMGASAWYAVEDDTNTMLLPCGRDRA